jgi:hypothetical protein
MSDLGQLIGTILRHDRKVTSYKLALVRSINDLVLAYPSLSELGTPIAIPLRRLAEQWIAYYWPFTSAGTPIQQGQQSLGKQDISFRECLSELHNQWTILVGSSRPSDGFFLVSELQTPHRRRSYPRSLLNSFQQASNQIARAIQMPIRHAGPGEWTVFPRPQRFRGLDNVLGVPGIKAGDACLLITAELWAAFRELSLWVEALCIHEWALYTERISTIDRGSAYVLLTERPDNRRPLTWERNQIELLMMEGRLFRCPWTGKRLSLNRYDLDHIIPVSVYPINEMWNLIPADRSFNQHTKRERLPSSGRLDQAHPILASTYEKYGHSENLRLAFEEDIYGRFRLTQSGESLNVNVATEVCRYVSTLSRSLNLAEF